MLDNQTPKAFTDKRLPNSVTEPFDFAALGRALTAQHSAAGDPATFKGLYHNVEALLICNQQRHLGLKTRKLTTPKEFQEFGLDQANFPTGVAYYQNAKDDNWIRQRLAPNHRYIALNEMLQRVLNVTRGVDHALDQLWKSTSVVDKDFLLQLRRQLKKWFTDFLEKSSDVGSLLELEQYYNRGIIAFLHACGLDEGVNEILNKYDDPRDKLATFYETLLVQYRFLAQTLEPAAAFVSECREHEINATIRETFYPITQKNQVQQSTFDAMLLAENYQPNFHKAQPPAIRLAQKLFVEQLKDPKTMLGPQLRKTIAPGVKNGYFTTLEVLFDGDDASNKTYRFGRCGTIVYAGKGLSEKSLKGYAEGNVKQLEAALVQHGFGNDLKIHFNCLNSNMRHNQEDRMVRVTEKTMKSTDHLFANTPMNHWSIVQKPFASRDILTSGGLFSEPTSTFSKIQAGMSGASHQLKGAGGATLSSGRFPKARAKFSGMLVKAVSTVAKTFSMYSCASGQDRTGATDEMAKAHCLQEAFQNKKPGFTFKDALDLRAKTLTSPLVATLATPGSFGMKSSSKPGNLFQEHSAQFYRKTANTGKHAFCPTGHVIAKTARSPSFYKTTFDTDTKQMDQADTIKSHVKHRFKVYLKRRSGFYSIRRLFFNTGLTKYNKDKAQAFLSTLETTAINQVLTQLNALKEALSQQYNEVNAHRWRPFKCRYGEFYNTVVSDAVDLIEKHNEQKAGNAPIVAAVK